MQLDAAEIKSLLLNLFRQQVLRQQHEAIGDNSPKPSLIVEISKPSIEYVVPYHEQGKQIDHLVQFMDAINMEVMDDISYG